MSAAEKIDELRALHDLLSLALSSADSLDLPFVAIRISEAIDALLSTDNLLFDIS